jgi:hypothetical protein
MVLCLSCLKIDGTMWMAESGRQLLGKIKSNVGPDREDNVTAPFAGLGEKQTEEIDSRLTNNRGTDLYGVC